MVNNLLDGSLLGKVSDGSSGNGSVNLEIEEGSQSVNQRVPSKILWIEEAYLVSVNQDRLRDKLVGGDLLDDLVVLNE